MRLNSTTRLRTGAGGVIAGILLLGGIAAPASAAPADDPFSAYLEVSPVEASGHSSTATFLQVPAESSTPLSYAQKTVQAVNDPDASATSLEIVHAFTGTVSSSVDLSEEFDTISSATAFHNYDAGTTLNAIVIGEHDGAARVDLVTSSSGTDFADASISRFDDPAVLDTESLALIGPAAGGLLVVNENESGEYIAKRVTYGLEAIASRPAVTLPFAGEPELVYDSGYGNIFALGDGSVQQVSIYSPDALTEIALPGLGEVTGLQLATGLAVASDAAGDVAVVDTFQQTVQSSFALPGAASGIAINASLNEILATATDGSRIWRYGTDGTARAAVETAGLSAQPGSLNSATGYNITHTFTADAGGTSYRYRMNYVSRYAIHFVGELRASERGSGVDLSFSSKGSGQPEERASYSWEYSLDDGASWAKSTESWDQAVPDIGNTSISRPELPAPLDGIAPSLRQDVSADGVIAPFNLSSTAYAVTLPEGSYDGLWRVRVENALGSVASEPQSVIIGDGEPDPSARFTRHPTSATVRVGQEARFEVEVAGDPEPTVIWQIARDGGEWEDLGAAGHTLELPAALEDDQALIRAVASNGGDPVASQAARLSVLTAEPPTIGAAPAGSVTVSDAAFNFQLNAYSNEWARDVFGDGAVVSEGNGFDFGGGTGWTNPDTGETQLLWDGTAIYRPYGGMNGLNLSFANPYLAIAADGHATLTADVFWNNGSGMGGTGSSTDSGSFARVVIATYVDADATTEDGALTFTGTPEWDHRPYVAPGLGDATEYASSFPASFLDYLDAGLRPWFLSTGNRNDEKPMPALSGTGIVTQDAASTDGDTVSATDPLGDGVYHFADVAPVVTTQPGDASAAAGDTVTLTAAASGYPEPKTIWQRQVDGAWVDIEGATEPTLVIEQAVAGDFVVRAKFTNRMGEAISETARVSVEAGEEPVEPSRPTDAPALPVASGDELTGADRGGLAFALEDTTVTVSGLRPGAWYYPTLYSSPIGIGWLQADASGEAAFELPDGLEPGSTHRVTVQDADEALVGWGEITLADAGGTDGTDDGTGETPDDGTHSGTDGTGGGDSAVPTTGTGSSSTVTGEALARTGGGSGQPIWVAALTLLAAGGILLAVRRTRTSR